MFALYFLNGVSQKTTQTAGKRIINVNTAPLIQQKREEEKKAIFHMYPLLTLDQIKFKFGQGNPTDIFMGLIHLR